MAVVEINRNPTPRELMQFAWVWLALFGVLGGVAWSRFGEGVAFGLWTVAFLVPVLGSIWSTLLRVVYLATAYATFPIGFVVSHLILAAVYFLVLTPIGLVLRLAGHDPLGRRPEPDIRSFWQERIPVDDRRRYFRQY